ncbi:transposase [Bradyrhizobium elkanii]|uniref:transposase n=1 Tax=Bradyrhizobium TaxID=374 RepID=UPI0035168111
MANSRLVALDKDHVALTSKITKLKPDEFIRSFLLHTLPDGFHRIPPLRFHGQTATVLPNSPSAANFSIVSGQRQTMASRSLWIRTL